MPSLRCLLRGSSKRVQTPTSCVNATTRVSDVVLSVCQYQPPVISKYSIHFHTSYEIIQAQHVPFFAVPDISIGDIVT